MAYILKKKISYFSYDGILEPLGNSQVLNYMMLLSNSYQITLFTFEKSNDINNLERLDLMKQFCIANSIDWKFSVFKEGSILSVFNPVKYCFFIFRNYFDISKIIHARSFIPCLVAYLISILKFNSKYIYDMRGYWVEEKVDVGKLNTNSIFYRVLSSLDSILIKNSAHIVTLSQISNIHIKNKYIINSKLISTIYTCTDLIKFNLSNKNIDSLCFGYVGTTIGWYQFDETLDFIKLAFNTIPNSIFKIITRDNKQDLINRIKYKNIDLSRIVIKSSSFENVQIEYEEIDIAVFFIKQSFSKSASMPTKFGEFLASGIPCIVNSGIGDMPSIVNDNPECGFVISEFVDDEYKNVIKKLSLLQIRNNSYKCRKVAEIYFSLERGASSYSLIYDSL